MSRATLSVAVLLAASGCGGGPGPVMLEPDVPAEYQVRLPEGYSPDEAYPLVVCLHGHDLDEAQITELWDARFFYEQDFILLAVRAPFRADEGFAWFKPESDDDGLGRDERIRASAEACERRVLDAVVECEEQYPVNADNRYIAGFSQGANVAFYVGLRNRDLFQGIAAFAGRVDTVLTPYSSFGDLAGMEVFLALGRAEGDRAVEAVRGDEIEFRRAHAMVRLQLHDGGHVIRASSCRAMQNFFDLSFQDRVPETDIIYHRVLLQDDDDFYGEDEPEDLTPVDGGL